MNTSRNKVTSLRQAISTYISDGAHLSIGGFTINRNPMAAVHEIIRQHIKDLHVYAHSNGQGVDELIGAGCISKLEIAYGGNGRFAPTCIRFAKAVQGGSILFEDYTNYQMSLRFLAGAMGLPFLPTRSSLGTDIVDRWGFPQELREQDPRMPGDKLVILDNPFGNWGDASKVVLVPAINPDVTVIHVQQCDPQGTARMEGLTFSDIEQARAARHVIVTCEKLVSSADLRVNPDRNQLPFFLVDAVVHVPFGAYPTACFGHYDYDPAYLKEYADCARDETRFQAYLDRYVHGVPDHQGLLELIGPERLSGIKADPERGYAKGLDRR